MKDIITAVQSAIDNANIWQTSFSVYRKDGRFFLVSTAMSASPAAAGYDFVQSVNPGSEPVFTIRSKVTGLYYSKASGGCNHTLADAERFGPMAARVVRHMFDGAEACAA